MKTRLCAVLLAVLSPALVAQPEVTLEKIMSDPEWVARSPTGASWSVDSRSVYYSREREGSDLSDLWRFDLEDDASVVVPDDDQHTADPATGSWDRARLRMVAVRSGDVFLSNAATDEVTRLTRSAAAEGRPSFMLGDAAVQYTRGGAVWVRDLESGLESQAAEIRFADAPDEARAEDREDPSYLERQQARFFETLNRRRTAEDERADRRNERRRLDPGDTPGPFYLPKDLEARRTLLAPSGNHMLIVAAEEQKDPPRDIMPNYVELDGYVESTSVRPKVGFGTLEDQRVFLLDLVTESWTELDRSSLPMLDDDPLAWLKEADDDADQDSADDGADKPEDRDVRVMNAWWSPDGRWSTVMIESHDNKDRWIAVADTTSDEPSLRTIHHMRDEAWINWSFNQAGWLLDGTGFWYLTEEHGHSDLHLWNPKNDVTTPLVTGAWEVSSVTESPGGGTLYFLGNPRTPISRQVHAIRVDGSAPRQITDLPFSVSSYRLSPDGSRLLLTASEPWMPPELWTVASRPGDTPRPITRTVTDEYESIDWVRPEFVPIASTHTEGDIWTKVYQIPGSWKGDPGERPGVVFVHGAGYTQNSDMEWPYYFREQMFHTMLARLGYVVIDMDYRASSGYGRDWRTAIYRRMGEPELEDFADGIDWMVDEHGVSPDRIGIYGGSYGGYMALMAIFRDADRYACGASLRPVTDWAHYNHGYTSNILNTPEIDPEAYERSSPIEFADGLEDPLLICHGMLDDNVVFQDTVRLAQRLIELEKQDWEVAMYPLEPHSFREPEGWLDEYRRIFKLFETHLRER